MSLNENLWAAVMSLVEANDGIFVVDGKTLVRREVLMAAMQAVTDELLAELRERLTAVVADKPEAAKNMAFEIAQSERRIKKFVAELLPVLN